MVFCPALRESRGTRLIRVARDKIHVITETRCQAICSLFLNRTVVSIVVVFFLFSQHIQLVRQTISLVLTDVAFRVDGCVILIMTVVMTQMNEAALQVICSFLVIASLPIHDFIFSRSVRNPKFKLKHFFSRGPDQTIRSLRQCI